MLLLNEPFHCKIYPFIKRKVNLTLPDSQNIILYSMSIIEKASIGDAALLVNLARDIYKEHYLHLWHPGGAEWYMNEYAYAAEKIKTDLADPGIQYYIAFDGNIPLGYLKLVLTSILEGYEKLDALEVERIYLHKKIMGKSVGRKFMEIAFQKAMELKKDLIFLKAMDSSSDAIGFYKKLGYTICGSLQLPMPKFHKMKEEYRGMLIMKMGLGKLY